MLIASPKAPASALARTPAPQVLGSEFLRDPYSAYRRLRDAGPLLWSEEFFGGAWLLTRHADCEAVLRDPRFSAQRTGGWLVGTERSRGEFARFQQLFARAMLFVDAPDHQRLRQAMAGGFKPGALQEMAPRIARWTGELLDAVDPAAGFDFMTALARPLPALVIAALMGVDDTDRAGFIDCSHDLAEFIGAPAPTHGQARRAQDSLLALAAHFQKAVKGDVPVRGMTASLLQARADGNIHDTAELLAQCAMLLFAGHETTRNLLGNGLFALLRDRQAWEQLSATPALLPSAIRELLRYDSPVQYTGRRVAVDLHLHSQLLRRGDLVIALIGSANHDESRYAAPQVLDVSRRQGASLAFGHGPHVCIGAALTQMEAEIAFGELLRRWPGLRLREPQPQWNGNPVYRGLTKLEVTCGDRIATAQASTPAVL